MFLNVRGFASVCAALVLASPLLATTYVVLPDRQMVPRADAIVLATAGTSFTQLAAYGSVETVTPFTVHEVIKGNRLIGASVNVHEPGGEFDGRVTIAHGVPRFEAGEKTILFLSRTPQGTWSVTDLALGRFTLEMDRAGRRLAVRAENEIVGWDQQGKPFRDHRRDAAAFLDFLRAEVRGEPSSTDYVVPYSPVKLPSSTSSLQTEVTSTFTATSYTSQQGDGTGARWFTFPTAVSFKYNFTPFAGTPGSTATGNLSNSLAALNGTFAMWNDDVGSNVALMNSGDDGNAHPSGANGSDGGNTVNFERSLAYIGVPVFSCPGNGSYGGTLGYAGPSDIDPKRSGPNGETFYAIVEGDADMNQGTSGCSALVTNGTFMGSVAHEIGHVLGFRHADQDRTNHPSSVCAAPLECVAVSPGAAPSAIMESFIDNGIAALQAYDINAVRAVYPGVAPSLAAVRNDLNGDRRSDILWRNSISGANAGYLMNGASVSSSGLVNFEVDGNYKIAGTGDFDGDGDFDIFWRNAVNGANVIYRMNGLAVTSINLINFEVDPNYKIVATGDFNGDRTWDVLWRNEATGANVIYLMNGGALASIVLLNFEVDMSYKIIGTGDFNGDGRHDVWWRHAVSGANVVYLMGSGGTSVASIALVNFEPDTNWKIQGFADFGGDGRADVLWRNSSSGANVIYTMNSAGTGVAASTLLNFEPDQNWKVAQLGDFNADNRYDILWRNSSSGANVMYLLNGAAIASSALVNFESDQNWKIIP